MAKENPEKSLPHAIIFDWDNTLVSTMEVICNALNHTLKTFNKPLISFDQAYQNTHQSPQDSFLELFGTDASEAMVIFYKFIQELPMEERFSPLPGAENLLEKIKRASIPMGVVSNKKPDVLRAEINFIGWQNYFRTVVGAGEAIADKPSPAPLNLALKRMGLDPAPTIWFIGDSPIDWACARQSGCKPLSIHISSSDPTVFHVTNFPHLEEIIDIKHNLSLPA